MAGVELIVGVLLPGFGGVAAGMLPVVDAEGLATGAGELLVAGAGDRLSPGTEDVATGGVLVF
jgi:hypothetical protein